MLTPILLATILTTSPVPEASTAFIQVGPPLTETRAIVRTPGQERAVVLIHGLTVHPLEERILRPDLHSWQNPEAPLVKRLTRTADVFAFAYGQNTSIADLVERSNLRQQLWRLRDLGYREIVLIGHSAGGILARQLVEDHPDLPVTRVVQVATPTLGSVWANIQIPWSAQKPFLDDLTKYLRRQTQSRRAEIRIPDHVEFVSVVANGVLLQGDGLVLAGAQWSEDLIAQRIPVHEVRTHHRGAVAAAEAVALLTRLATTPQPRWSEAEVMAAKRKLLGR